MLTKLKNLVTVSSLTAIAIAFTQNTAQALTFDLSEYNDVDNTYTYSLSVDANESMSTTDFIRLSNMLDVDDTNTTINNTDFAIDTLNSTTVQLQPTTDITGAQTYDNLLTINSVSLPGEADYSAAHSTSFLSTSLPVTSSSTMTGPATPVPFELSPNLGIFTILGIVGLNYYRKSRQS